jgi:hypothetical protein
MSTPVVLPASKPPSKLFIPIQAGIFEHIGNGRMTINMWAVYSVILKEADYETGIWNGCAEKARAAWNSGIDVRTAQRAMKELREGGYTKSFQRNGQRGNYPVFINKYPVRFGSRKGMRLNADATIAPENPVYEIDPRQEHENNRDKQNDSASVNNAKPMSYAPADRDKDVSNDNVTPHRDTTSDTTSDRTNDRTNDTTSVTHDAYSRVPELLDFPDVQSARETKQHQQQPNPVVDDDERRRKSVFFGQVTERLDGYGLSARTSNKHREQSWRLAEHYGHELFLAAFERWLDRYHEQLDETWILRKFNEEGALLIIQEFERLKHVCTPTEAKHLLEVEDREDEKLSVETAKRLIEAMRQYGYFPVKLGCRHADDITAFLSNPESYLPTGCRAAI